MGERSGYKDGQFCWVDLATTDQEGAKKFYGDLFGWQANDMPVGDGSVYSMIERDGKYLCAISAQPEAQREAGAPPAWNNYVAVESADDTAEKAKELGATVHAPAFDVLEAGRMAVIQDPQGAFFMPWQAKDHIGAQLVNTVGALAWNELSSTDIDGSDSFYSGLFDWEIQPTESTDPPYRMIKNGEEWNGGMLPQQMPGAPSFWLPYFGAEDVAATLGKVKELGGITHGDPREVQTPASGPGMIGIAEDPQGAFFAVYAGDYQP